MHIGYIILSILIICASILIYMIKNLVLEIKESGIKYNYLCIIFWSFMTILLIMCFLDLFGIDVLGDLIPEIDQ